MPPAVTVVGSLNLDLVVTVETLPGRGETAVGRSTTSGPGGKGANQAAAAGSLSGGVAMVGRVGDEATGAVLVTELRSRGVDVWGGVAMVGRVGDDAAGAVLLADLRSRGVDVAGVSVTPGVPTGSATVAVEGGSGENLIVVAPGANAAMARPDVEVEAVRTAAVVLLQLEVPLAAVAAAAAHATGTVVLNPAPPQPLSPGLIGRVDVLVPNEWELARLAGVAPHHRPPDELAELARTLGAAAVVVTMGARGALVLDRDRPPVVVAAPTVEAVDTTGAGDCFCGALCVALARGSTLLDATRYAVVAAALSTTGAGARGAVPSDAAVRALLG